MIITPELQAALLPVWLPLLLSPCIYLFRRIGLLASVASSAVMGYIAYWLYTHPAVEGLNILGRALLMSNLEKGLLIILALWLAAAFLFAWRISQGWSLYPFLLAAYSLISLALLFEELVIQVIILQIAWLVVILLVQGGAQANTRAGTRLLVLVVLALPAFLIGASLIGLRAEAPDTPLLDAFTVLAFGMGFALMLAIIPFHAWLPQAVEDGPPLVAAWLVAGMGGSYLLVLFDLLAEQSWLAQDPQVQRLLFIGGLVLGVGGGLLTVTERHLGRLWAYAVLTDLGYILLGLSLNSLVGTQAALLVLANRFICVLLAGGALATIRHHATSLDFDQLVGLAGRLPISVLAFALGSLAMFGVPLTGGFPGHWAILRQLLTVSSGWTVLLVVSSALGALGFIRAFAVMVSRPEDEADMTRIATEPPLVVVMLALLGVLSLAAALAPQTFTPMIAYLMQGFNF